MNRVLSSTWIFFALLLIFCSGCVIGEPVKEHCKSAEECGAGLVCFEGRCLSAVVEPDTKREVIEAKEQAKREAVVEAAPGEEPVVVTDGGSENTVGPEGGLEGQVDQAPVCVDEDKDGYCANMAGPKGPVDCDDKDKSIFPGGKEVCNGKDDDCNGQIDDNLGEPPLCSKQEGVCKGAKHQSCLGEKGWAACEARDYIAHAKSAYQESELTCDGLDNNCNGLVDETFSEKGQPCGVPGKLGECARGNYTACQGGKKICTTNTTPKTEICGNGLDDNCDGKTDETPPCFCKAGEREPCYSAPVGCPKSNGKYVCLGTCQVGTRTCDSNSQWGACKGAVEPSAESCDGKDNNCDGKVDESFPEKGKQCADSSKKGECSKGTSLCKNGQITCESTTSAVSEVCFNTLDDDCDGVVDESDCTKALNTNTSIIDYAVLQDGSPFALSLTSSTTLRGLCLNKDGTVKKALFTIATASRIEYPSVKASRGIGVIVVAWIGRTTTSSSTRKLYARVYDGSCNSVTSAISMPVSLSGAYNYDVAIDGAGNFAVASFDSAGVFSVSFYNKAGTPLGAQQAVDSEKTRCSTGYAVHVAMNASGVGLLSCQKHASNPIYYRRFSSGRVLEGTAMKILAETTPNLSSWYESHIIGINDKGAFAFQWQDRQNGQNKVAFFDATGTKVTSFALFSDIGNGYDGFRYPSQVVDIVGDDFVFRDTVNSTATPTRWFRYSAAGKLVSAEQSSHRSYLTRWGGGRFYTSDSRIILLGGLDLSAGKGVCGTRPCVCEAGKTRTCYTGGSTVRAPCKSGTQTCSTNGLSWGTCIGETLPVPEICGNGKDDDCDGKSDENCALNNVIQPVGVTDLSAAKDGTLATIFWNGKILRLTCFRPDRSVLRANVDVSEEGAMVSYPTVKIEPSSKKVLVSWFESTSSRGARTGKSRVFDANCSAVTSAFVWASQLTSSFIYDADIDANGRVAIVYRNNSVKALISFFDGTGKALKSDIQIDSVGSYCRTYSSAALHIALHPTLQTGVVTCQNSSSYPLYMRRFRLDGTFVETSMVVVKNSEPRNSSYYQTHILGMNSRGEFAIQWQNRASFQFEANIYSAAGALQKHLILSSRMESDREAFAYPHQAVELYSDEFVFRDGGRSSNLMPRWMRYDQSGALRSAAFGDSTLRRETLRVGGIKTFVVGTDNLIYVDRIDLKTGQGLCAGVLCVCSPMSTRACYSGGSSARVPCKKGVQTCAADGMSWGVCVGEVPPLPEVCGNMKDDDCDGQIDEGCPSTNTIDTPGLSDYAVSSDGSVVRIHWTGTALVGSCFHPDRSVKKGHFVISVPGRYVLFPVVKMAATSKHFLVAWFDSSGSSSSFGKIVFRLYDGNCSAVTPVTSSPRPAGSFSYFSTAIDANGNFALVWGLTTNINVNLSLYDKTGKKLGADLKVDPADRYCRSSYAYHVSLQPSGKVGLISCQQFYNQPVYYRRFNFSGTWVDTAMVAVVQSGSNKSSYNRSHLSAINDLGEYVIYWQNRTDTRFEANFYTSSKVLTRNVIVSTVMRYNYEAFNSPQDQVVLFGNDFVLRDGGRSGSPVTWYRYKSNGSLVGKVAWPTSSYLRTSLRVGNGKIHITSGNTIYIGTIIFQ